MTVAEIHHIEVTCTIREGERPCDWRFAHENSAFVIDIADGSATFRFKYPLSSLDEAERRVTDFLRSWEGDMLLQGGPLRRRFRISGSRAPGHGSHAYAYAHATIGGALAEANTRRQKPWRRHRYWEFPLPAALIQRYEDYRAGRERLAVLGFLCLSALQHSFGGRKALAAKLSIEMDVLNELARLVSTVGTYRSARKVDKDHELREFTPDEEYWIESVAKELIWRAGEVFSGHRLGSVLTRMDLPSA